MPYIPPEVVAQVREMDLLTYLRTYEPQELVHFGGSTYCTREQDSLKISNGKWCWFSRGIGGYSALDYLIKVKEMPFTQAIETIMGNLSAVPPAFAPAPKASKEKVLLLPQVNRRATHAVEYLRRRGIDYELINFCIKTGRLYESYPYHNAVFVGMDADGKPRYANQRGIGSDFIGDANGSDKPERNSGVVGSQRHFDHLKHLHALEFHFKGCVCQCDFGRISLRLMCYVPPMSLRKSARKQQIC